MAIAPLLSSLTVVLATRAMLTPVGRGRAIWVRLVIAVAIQALLAAARIVDSANWWIIAAVILVIDIMHLLLISLIKAEHLPQLLSFILTVIAISATLGATGLVPSYNSLAANAAYEVVRSNTLLSSIRPPSVPVHAGDVVRSVDRRGRGEPPDSFYPQAIQADPGGDEKALGKGTCRSLPAAASMGYWNA